MKEIEMVTQRVPSDYIVWVVLCIFMIVMIALKVLPEIIKAFNAARNFMNNYEQMNKLVISNSESIEKLSQYIEQDYANIKNMQSLIAKQQEYIDDGLEERELVVRTLLRVVQGLQEIGANGPTKLAEAEIKEYLIKKAHERE